MSRDMDKNPYSPDERRVAEFFFNLGVGGGDDPIGFILASYRMMAKERQAYLQKLADISEVLTRELLT